MRLRPNKEELSMCPSVVILQGLEDLRECVKDPRYTIDMDYYHRPHWGRRPRRFKYCQVCLAGSSMAKRYQTNPHKSVYPQDMPLLVLRRLLALDKFRSGDVRGGFDCLCLVRPPGVPSFYHVTPYGRSKLSFHLDMKNLAAMLRRHGL